MQFGKLTSHADGFQISFERRLNHPIEKVWDAITDPDKLKEWFTDIEMDFRAGGKITIRFRDKDKTASFGRIVKIAPPNEFVFTWEEEVASWHLTKESDDVTLLKFTHSKISDEYAISVSAGFHFLLDQLVGFLAGQTVYHDFGSGAKDPGQEKLQVLYHVQAGSQFPAILKYKPVVVEKIIKSTVDKVWAALTSKDKMKHWYFDLDAFRPEVGFTFRFPGTGNKGENYMHVCTVIEVIPSQKLAYSWAYENYPGYSVVVFELADTKEGVHVKLSHYGLETFPENNSDFARTSFNAGWSELIGNLLPAYMEKSV